MPKLRTVVPRGWLVRILGRAAAKLVTASVVALRERPSWVLGYNLVPHGVNAVLIAKLAHARAYVHVIGGPVEWEGGGYRSDNKVLGRLPRPVPILERMLVRVLKSADVVAVMGSRARADLLARGLAPQQVVVLPASVDMNRVGAAVAERTYDVVTAAQLIPRKRLHELLQALAIVRKQRPDLR